MTDGALERLSPRFDGLYSTTGRPSIPPEQLLRALLLQMLYSIRSERLLVERVKAGSRHVRVHRCRQLPRHEQAAAQEIGIAVARPELKDASGLWRGNTTEHRGRQPTAQPPGVGGAGNTSESADQTRYLAEAVETAEQLVATES